MSKITEEEKQMLIEKRIAKIDVNKTYAMDLFKVYFKESPKENLRAWGNLTKEKKVKLMKYIIKKEDKEMSAYCFSQHKLNPKKALELLAGMKDSQLKEFGVRQ